MSGQPLEQLSHAELLDGDVITVRRLLAENHAVLSVLFDAGWPCTQHRDGSELHVEVDLDKVG